MNKIKTNTCEWKTVVPIVEDRLPIKACLKGGKKGNGNKKKQEIMTFY